MITPFTSETLDRLLTLQSQAAIDPPWFDSRVQWAYAIYDPETGYAAALIALRDALEKIARYETLIDVWKERAILLGFSSSRPWQPRREKE